MWGGTDRVRYLAGGQLTPFVFVLLLGAVSCSSRGEEGADAGPDAAATGDSGVPEVPASSVSVTREYDAPIDLVWSLAGDFSRISTWHPTSKVTRVEGDGVGMLRHVDTDYGPFVERLESYDAASFRLSYTVVEGEWPITQYLATVQLEALGADRCRISFSATFRAVSADVRDMMEETMRDLYGLMLETMGQSVDAVVQGAGK